MPPQSGQPVLSALDLGTNNCRLLVARPQGKSFRVIDAFSRIVRLGEGVAASGRLSEEAIDRTVEALRICARKMRERGVTHMRNVATQACRQAMNCDDFVERVVRETGIELDIIPPAEEARLAVMGCQALLDRGVRRAIVFDIGGGSTELIWTTIMPKGQPKILGWMSMPLGVVNMSEIFMGNNDVTPESYRAMVDAVRERLIPFDKRYNLSFAIKKGGVQMIGTSGTITTLTSVHLDLPRYDRTQVDGASVDSEALAALCQKLAGQDYQTRAANKCVGTDRAELIVAGCAILDAILSIWAVPRISVADRGIREGMLIELMQAAQHDLRTGKPFGRTDLRASNQEQVNVE
ncbi:Ppx/GppA phosphatase family protein [Govanella unica]|uniref:Ppx/GppA family phosphatase n=1 Tax=Govanella unica TaxID=2975056 RepID=A0A9X3Z7M0_9PROT|nr:Ppx/GppA phosphatase family protein [Govania unica]MDA5194312.1 Ppx/GppA family phosphatase [Govania unica]